MSSIFPIMFTWDGEGMKPLDSGKADRQFVVGEEYRLGVIEERSVNSHNHYFAALNDAWKNLPEEFSVNFPSVEHLRKWALIKGGYRDERSVACTSKAEAIRLAAFIKPMDSYAIISVSECSVVVYTAKSQSQKAMGKKDFQESKDKVLNVVSQLIGVSTDDLRQNAGQAA